MQGDQRLHRMVVKQNHRFLVWHKIVSFVFSGEFPHTIAPVAVTVGGMWPWHGQGCETAVAPACRPMAQWGCVHGHRPPGRSLV